MLRAIERGLTLSDFNELTLGMILGYITTYNNERLDEDEEETVKKATQDDFDRF